MNTGTSTTRILGINFFNGPITPLVAKTLSGGLLVAPSGPGLATDLQTSPAYREALSTADIAITDSGWMVLLWRLFTRQKITRTSGLELVRAILQQPEVQSPGSIFWIMPSAEEDTRNRSWLNTNGIPTTPADTTIAPHYPTGTITDPNLLSQITAHNPRVIIIAIGGGVQERLGLYLRNNLPTRPAILCIGAAIAFLTGGQANIPVWADRLYLGWLFRILHNPKKFWRRYYEALALAPLLYKHRTQLPPLKPQSRP